jgi:hypothetical protein
MLRRSLSLLVFAGLLHFATGTHAAVTVEKSDKGAVVKIDGDLFTEYVIKADNKPVLWPIIGPTGKAMTRAFPMVDTQDITNDHPHHRGLWFTHGSVNKVMFWNLGKNSGEVVHRELTKLESGETGTIAAHNEWLGPDGKRVCTEDQTFRFSGDKDARIIDATLTLKATDGPLTLGDDKEGAFAVRVPDSMRVDSKKGGKIVNSEGATDGAAWGKPANWVDYHGPVDGESVGIAMLDHPANPGHPVRWHVRTYGLFAANPFTRKAFDPSQSAGTIQVPAGESVTFRYRIVLHAGDEKNGKIAERYSEFAK